MPHYPTDGSWAVPPLPLAAGDKVKFAGDRLWWTVQAVSDNFAALVRQAEFEPRGVMCYTVIDWRNGVRGPCDLVGQGWGDGTYTVDECTELLDAFEAGARPIEPGPVHETRVHVSQRNNVRINIVEHRPAVAAAAK